MAASAVCQAKQLAIGKGNEGVLAHVRRDGKRAIGVESHKVAAESSNGDGCSESRVVRNSRSRQNGRVNHLDVRHRGESGKASNDFTRESCLMKIKIEQRIQCPHAVKLIGDNDRVNKLWLSTCSCDPSKPSG